MLLRQTGYQVTGGLGVLLSAGYLAMAINLPFGQAARPGAAIFPILCGTVLLLASIAVLWESWAMNRTEQVELPAGADLWRLLGLVALLIAYFLAIPWLGQFLASAVFCVLLIRVLSRISWPRALISALLISGAIHAVFIRFFKVPMPRGFLSF